MKLIDYSHEKREDHLVELQYQMEILKERKESFLSLEFEIERNVNVLETTKMLYLRKSVPRKMHAY